MASIVFAGIGGQGVITVATIVGKAAVADGKNALMTELHGMAQRGGRISVELRIGNYESAIIPEGKADAIVGFEEMEAARNVPKLKENGIILVNRRRIHPVTLSRTVQEYPQLKVEEILGKYRTYYIEADAKALELGNKKVVNTIMLGALYSTGLLNLNEQTLLRVLEESFDERYRMINSNAFSAGKMLVGQEITSTV
jgi:indolepyruvate ferredoxin oxidoreductase beta subunit